MFQWRFQMRKHIFLGDLSRSDDYFTQRVDIIYHSYLTFVISIPLPQSEEDKLFAHIKRDIERGFGILQARFKIIRELARMWEITDLAVIMRSCIIFHDMIVED